MISNYPEFNSAPNDLVMLNNFLYLFRISHARYMKSACNMRNIWVTDGPRIGFVKLKYLKKVLYRI